MEKIHSILDPKNDRLEEEYKDIFVELILLGMADTLGSQLKRNKPDEFKFRINFYKKIINGF